ncbi:MAG: phospholipid carrier-dependent glycosyltransferase [Phycisphaerae bacterium]|nr:phospholipid carrier-dependent glycosyltransferase [Phycisphaerae bacterium]
MTWRKVLCVVVLVLPAAGGSALSLHATRYGIGVNADAVYYVSSARELAAGNGLTVPWGFSRAQPLTRWPPLYPGALAGLERLGLEPLIAARWLNALLFGGTILLFSIIVRRATGSLWLASCGAALLATSLDLLAIHTMAWSEPLFLFLTLAAFWFVAIHGTTRRLSALVIASSLLASALLTRYAGGAVVLAGVLSLWWGMGSRRDRLLRSATAVTLASLPMILWMARNRSIGLPVAGRHIVWLPCSAENMLAGCRIIADWMFPCILPRTPPGNVSSLVLTLLVAIIFAVGTVWARRSSAFRETEHPASQRAHLCWISGLFLLVYPLSMILAVSLADPAINFGGYRLMQMMLIPGLLLALLGGHALWEYAGRNRVLAIGATAVCLGVLVVRAPRAVDHSIQLPKTSGFAGPGFHDAKWRGSPTIEAVKALEPSVPL